MNRFLQRKWLLLIMLLFPLAVLAQSPETRGVVTDNATGEKLPGVAVKLVGTSRGVITDAAGQFSIPAAPGGKLRISFLGYKSVEVPANSVTPITVKLDPTSKELLETVVVGYSTQRKSSVTGALSVVSGKTIANQPNPNVAQLLQGKAAGVQVTAANGQPGQNAFIRIRGVGSFRTGDGAQDPLFVVDGVPSTTLEYNALNPNDIETLTVLKDASSSAIYGSRGANGVVLITTKHGKKGDPSITLSTQFGQQSVIPLNFSLMNTDQKLQYEYNLHYTNQYLAAALPAAYNGADIQSVPQNVLQTQYALLKKNNTDWQGRIFKRSPFIKNEVTLSGSSDNMTYYIALNQTFQKGTIVGSDFKQLGGRLNVEYSPKPWFTIGTNENVSSVDQHLIRDRYNAQNPTYVAYQTNSYEPVYNKDGSYNTTTQGFSVLEAIKNNPETIHTINSLGNLYAVLKPVKNLQLKTSLGLNYTNYTRESFIKPGSILDQYVGDPAAPGSKTDNGTNTFNYVWTNTAQYNWMVNADNHFNFLAGQEFTREKYYLYKLSSKGYASGNLSTQDNSSAPVSASTSRQDWALSSLFGKVSYDYQQKYFIDGSFRRDGSSRFGSAKQYGNFYSGGAAWDLSKEQFLTDVKFINQLKLRASAGTSGNFNLPNYPWQGLYKYGSYNNQSASYPNQLANPQLTWEKQTALTAGLDFALFNTALTGSFDVYSQKRDGLLQNVPISPTVGFSSITQNLGALTNKGVEIALSYDVVRTHDFKFNVFGNVSFNKNRVTKITGTASDSLPIPQGNGITAIAVGQPINEFYLTRWAGVDPATGNAQYLDKHGKLTQQYSSGNAVILKNKSPNPTYFGTLGFETGYKGLTLRASAYFSGGNYINNQIYQDLNTDGANIYANQGVSALNYWKKPGDIVSNPKPVANQSTPYSNTTDRWLQKGDFVRLRDVTLSYVLPTRITQKFKCQSLRVYLTGYNLLTYRPHYKGDPEVGIGSGENDLNSNGIYSAYSYPNYRSWTMGLSIGF